MALALYEIEQNLAQLTNRIIENGGEVDEETIAALELGREQLEQKAIAYGYVIMQADMEGELIDAEIERLKKLKAARAKAGEFLRSRIDSAMKHFGVEEVKTPTLRINFRKSTAVEIVDEAQIPTDFIIATTTYSVDKKAIGVALKAGETVTGARLDHRLNLQIK